MGLYGESYGDRERAKLKASSKDGDVITRIEKIVKGDSVFRTGMEQTWFTNHLNYLGFQWSMIDTDTSTLREVPGGRVRFRANKLQAAVNHSVAKLTSNAPDWDVDLRDGSSSLASGRNVAERYLEYVWDSQHMPVRTKELATNIRVYGTGLLYTYWDPNAGEALDPKDFFSKSLDDKQNTIEDLMDVFGDEESALRFLEGEDVYSTGDVRIDVVSPFDFYIDDAATCVEDAHWAMVLKVRGIEQVRNRWGSKAEKVVPQSIGTGFGPTYKYQLRQMVSPNVVSGGTAQTRIENACLVAEYWERPSRKHKRGRYIVYSGGVVLHSGPNPNAGTTAEIPFVRFRDTIIPDRFYGQAALESAIMVQRDYNKARSDLIEHRHIFAVPKWIAPRGSVLKASSIDPSATSIIEYTPFAPGASVPLRPERISGLPTSPLITDSLALADAEIQEIMGVHDVSQGKVPTGVSSGVAIQLLQEGDDTRLGSIMEEMTQGYTALGMMVLDLSQKYITEQRTFREIAGENSAGDVVAFMSKDLSYRNVRIRMGSIHNRSKVMKEQKLMELLQYGAKTGIFDAPQMRRLVVNGLGLSSDTFYPGEVHERRARAENASLEAGNMEKVYVSDYQDHAVHLQTLEDRMNEPSFDELPEEVQQMFHMHRLQHKIAQNQAVQEQLAIAQGMNQMGGGPSPGMGPQLPPPGTDENAESGGTPPPGSEAGPEVS